MGDKGGRKREILLIDTGRFAYAILKMETNKEKVFDLINYNSGAFISIKQSCRTENVSFVKLSKSLS